MESRSRIAGRAMEDRVYSRMCGGPLALQGRAGEKNGRFWPVAEGEDRELYIKGGGNILFR